ncbi:MAG TPA: YdeI/OmpD-associated family protein [Thermoanaerobaculia bacterium]
MKPTFFSKAADFRKWLERNHDRVGELWIGFHKLASGRGGITYREALDEALAFGWIDGLKKSVDAESYMMRFSPRKLKSNWSAVNIKRMKELIAEKRVRPPGLAAFEKRDEKKARAVSELRRGSRLDPASERAFKANETGWRFFTAQPPGYQKLCVFWVMDAKKEETRQKRLAILIATSAKETRVDLLKTRAAPK